jgi:hypothetical protein
MSAIICVLGPIMGTENQRHSNPDELGENDRTGDEPNPSGKSPKEKDERDSAKKRD